MGARFAFGVLGPLEVRLDDAEVRVGGPRQRALLGLLLCHANRVVSRDQLIEELLGDQPPAAADRMLRVQVSRLRKALGDGNGNGEPRLLARPPGYLLRVEDGELDLHAFEQQVAAGRQALEDGDPARAARLLREAEAWWRGRPLADLEFESIARLEVRRLETLRLQVVEDRIDAELAAGRHAPVCPELEQLVAEHPMRERLRGQLMIAPYRCGRQADALQTYRAGRSLLVEELAVEPGPQLRKLQLAVLEQDAALDLRQADLRLLRPRQRCRHHRRQRILRPRRGPADRPGRRRASHRPGRRGRPVGPARPPAHRPGHLGSHRHRERARLPVQPGAQLPVQPGLGSAHRPVLDPVTPGYRRDRSAGGSRWPRARLRSCPDPSRACG
jgi:DNA-binding SARP family transcriptional activator